jgi:long-chain acyl-CoA synthetase
MFEERPWLKNYPSGVPANINPEQYKGVADLLDVHVKKYEKSNAFTCMGASLTYRDLDKKSTQFGAYLQSRGLEKGDRIALMMPNLLQYPIAIFGALKAGLIIVNTNPLYTPREMQHQFVSSGVKAILIAENFAYNLEKVLPQTQIKTVVITKIGELLGFFKGMAVNAAVKYVKRLVPNYTIANTVTFTEAMAQGKKFTLQRVEENPDDVILHQYTGGTTGVSKGAMLSNRNIIANVLQIRACMEPFLEEGKEVALCPLPMYHSFAFTVNCCAMLSFGAHSILIVNPRQLSTIVDAFNKYPISLMTGVNTLFNAMLHFKPMQALDFSKLKVCVAGGMAMQTKIMRSWKEMTGCSIAEGYGLTETSPVATVNPIDGSGVEGSIGLPVPSTIVKIVKEDGTDAGLEEEGEIYVKGPQVMKGYYNQAEETAKVFDGEWLITGDIGKMMEGGYFAIVDRKKDMINVSGFNVYPNEIEDVIATHPKVLEVAVIGIPNDKSGEVVKAFVVRKDKNVSEKEIIAWASESLTKYKLPRSIEFRDELPKTNVGKILRRALKE